MKDEAFQIAEKGISFCPNCPATNYILANFYKEQSNREKTKLHLQRVVELSPQHIDARKQLALMLIDDNELLEAAKLFNEIHKLNPSDHDAEMAFELINQNIGDGKKEFREGEDTIVDSGTLKKQGKVYKSAAEAFIEQHAEAKKNKKTNTKKAKKAKAKKAKKKRKVEDRDL